MKQQAERGSVSAIEFHARRVTYAFVPVRPIHFTRLVNIRHDHYHP